MDIRNLSAHLGYAAARPATRPDPQEGAAGRQLGAAAGDFAATLKNGESAALGAMTGTVDPHALVQALAQTELAVETAVTVRNKVIEAYQEIMRMPV